MRQGDIFFVSLDPTVGREQRGLRPVLIITPERFNRMTGTPLVATITKGGQFAIDRGLTVDLSGAGTRTVGVVRCDQIRTLDLFQRKARYVETVPGAVLFEVLDLLVNLIDPN